MMNDVVSDLSKQNKKKRTKKEISKGKIKKLLTIRVQLFSFLFGSEEFF